MICTRILERCKRGYVTVSSIHDIFEQKYEVTPLELFFDLVFVFAVSQLSHHLLTHLSWRGAAEALVMLLAIFAVWFSTSWTATMIRADQSRTRWLVLGVMLLGLFMNASVTRAFSTSGWAFVVPLLLIQLGRAVWTFVNSPDALFRDHYFRVLLWLSATTPLWIAGAAVSFGRSHRLVLRHLEKTIDPIRTSRHAANALMVMDAGLVAVAVANEMVISNPRGHASYSLSVLLAGGPILFLAAQGLYLWAVLSVRSRLHLIGGFALLLVGLATLAAPPYAASILVGTSLTTLAILDRQMIR